MPVLPLAASVGQRYCRRLWGCVVVGDGVVNEVSVGQRYCPVNGGRSLPHLFGLFRHRRWWSSGLAFLLSV